MLHELLAEAMQGREDWKDQYRSVAEEIESLKCDFGDQVNEQVGDTQAKMQHSLVEASAAIEAADMLRAKLEEAVVEKNEVKQQLSKLKMASDKGSRTNTAELEDLRYLSLPLPLPLCLPSTVCPQLTSLSLSSLSQAAGGGVQHAQRPARGRAGHQQGLEHQQRRRHQAHRGHH